MLGNFYYYNSLIDEIGEYEEIIKKRYPKLKIKDYTSLNKAYLWRSGNAKTLFDFLIKH